MFLALIAYIGEYFFVAFDAVGVVIPQNVSLTCQLSVALPTAKVVAMPILVHGFCVFAGKYQLNDLYFYFTMEVYEKPVARPEGIILNGSTP